jgi:phenylalanyl-tRNA synthetase alpha chain
MLKEKIEKIKEAALVAVENAKTVEEVLQLEIQFLGRKSEFVGILRQLKDVSPEEKKEVGQLANAVKVEIQTLLDQKKKNLASTFDAAAEKIDVTVPAVKLRRGHLHPLTQIQNEIEDIFTSMGFEIADGPEVEDEFHNFDALNMPKDHPARDMQDTFWLRSQTSADKTQTKADNRQNDTEEKKGERILLRTHTSNVQIRYMETHEPPFRIIAPGRIYRNEAGDSTHEHTFHQFEALVVGDDINVGNFKFVAQQFFSKFFKKDIQIRIRPSFFPFTEPSFEFDISCTVCGGKGCSACKNAGWLEIGGAGMVNQNVFVAAGYPRNKYQGFAWGFGVERLAMMKYKISDIRLFHSGDLRFIKQF